MDFLDALDRQFAKAHSDNVARIDSELDKRARQARAATAAEDPVVAANLAKAPPDLLIRFRLDVDDGDDLDSGPDPLEKFLENRTLDSAMRKPEPVTQSDLDLQALHKTLTAREEDDPDNYENRLRELVHRKAAAALLDDNDAGDGAPLHKITSLHQSQINMRGEIDEFATENEKELLDKALRAMDFSCFTELCQIIIERVKLQRAAAA